MNRKTNFKRGADENYKDGDCWCGVRAASTPCSPATAIWSLKLWAQLITTFPPTQESPRALLNLTHFYGWKAAWWGCVCAPLGLPSCNTNFASTNCPRTPQIHLLSVSVEEDLPLRVYQRPLVTALADSIYKAQIKHFHSAKRCTN